MTRGEVLAAIPTPFTADGELDTVTAGSLIKFAAGATDGMLIAGTTGEFPALDDAERLSLFEMALAAAGPQRVIAHVGAPDAYHAARLAKAAAAAGATRLAVITPYYMAASQDDVREHYLRVRAAVPSVELYAYFFPERTGVTVPAAELASLADAAGLAGAKLSGSAAKSMGDYAAAAPKLRLYSGDDSDLARVMRSGGAGIISGRSSACPGLFMGLAAAIEAGVKDDIERFQHDVSRIVGLGTSLGMIKAALRMRGFGPLASRLPVGEPSGDALRSLQAVAGPLITDH